MKPLTLFKIMSSAFLLLVLALGSGIAGPVKKILILTKESPTYAKMTALMRKELGGRYLISEMIMEKAASSSAIQEKVDRLKPDLLLLMDNEAVQFALQYNQGRKRGQNIRGVAVMGLNFQSILKGNEWISGVAFEPPGFTLITQFRYVTGKPIKNILTIYRRSAFREMVEQASQDLMLEGITLHSQDVERNGVETDRVESVLIAELQSLSDSKGKYDAVWVLLDSALLSQALFSKIWIPAARASGIPFITSSDTLVSKEMEFATFAVTPNLADMASQTAQQVEQILRERVSPKDLGVERVVSVDKILNLELASKIKLSVRDDRMGDVRRVE